MNIHLCGTRSHILTELERIENAARIADRRSHLAAFSLCLLATSSLLSALAFFLNLADSPSKPEIFAHPIPPVLASICLISIIGTLRSLDRYRDLLKNRITWPNYHLLVKLFGTEGLDESIEYSLRWETMRNWNPQVSSSKTEVRTQQTWATLAGTNRQGRPWELRFDREVEEKWVYDIIKRNDPIHILSKERMSFEAPGHAPNGAEASLGGTCKFRSKMGPHFGIFRFKIGLSLGG